MLPGLVVLGGGDDALVQQALGFGEGLPLFFQAHPRADQGAIGPGHLAALLPVGDFQVMAVGLDGGGLGLAVLDGGLAVVHGQQYLASADPIAIVDLQLAELAAKGRAEIDQAQGQDLAAQGQALAMVPGAQGQGGGPRRGAAGRLVAGRRRQRTGGGGLPGIEADAEEEQDGEGGGGDADDLDLFQGLVQLLVALLGLAVGIQQLLMLEAQFRRQALLRLPRRQQGGDVGEDGDDAEAPSLGAGQKAGGQVQGKLPLALAIGHHPVVSHLGVIDGIEDGLVEGVVVLSQEDLGEGAGQGRLPVEAEHGGGGGVELEDAPGQVDDQDAIRHVGEDAPGDRLVRGRGARMGFSVRQGSPPSGRGRCPGCFPGSSGR